MRRLVYIWGDECFASLEVGTARHKRCRNKYIFHCPETDPRFLCYPPRILQYIDWDIPAAARVVEE